MKAKKHHQMMKRHWRLEYKNFLNTMGELGLPKPILRWWERSPSKVGFKMRLKLAWAILRAPSLARKDKLVEYIDKRWVGKGLESQKWVEYVKVMGLVRFNCRTKMDKPGHMVQIMVNDTYWDEGKALKLLPPDWLKAYNEAEVKG